MPARFPPTPALSAPTRVLLADDDPIVRRALHAVLESAEIAVEGEARSVDQAVRLAQELNPAAVLADIRLPEDGGMVLAERLRDAVPDAQVILLASVEDPDEGLEGLRAGARGYLSKEVAMRALPRAVDAVIRGEVAISRRLAGAVVEELHRESAAMRQMRPVHSTLTDREWEVLDLLCSGLGTDGIANELVLARETVRSHIKHVIRKLGVSSRAEAIQEAENLRTRPTERASAVRTRTARAGVHPGA